MKKLIAATWGLFFLSSIGQVQLAAAQEQKLPPGMAIYQLVLLKQGPKWTGEVTDEIKRMQSDHLAHLTSLAKAGKLVGAGPIVTKTGLSGILIFANISTEEAKLLAESDPMVKAGRLVAEIHPWMAQKGIGEKYAAMSKTDPNMRDEMISYQFGLLVRGPRWTAEVSPETLQIQKEHLANINRLSQSGKLIVAGPFADGGVLRGVFIFRAGSLEEAKSLAQSDPAVKAGRLEIELHGWLVAKGVLE